MKMEHWSPTLNPLFQLDNCFFTPHTSYISQEALNECRHIAAENVNGGFAGAATCQPGAPLQALTPTVKRSVRYETHH